jgi:hypothetical protein
MDTREGGIRATGGALEPEKSFWYLIRFCWKYGQGTYVSKEETTASIVKLLPLPQPPMRARTDARTNPSAQRATQLRSVPARVYAVSIQNQITTIVP